MKLSYTTKINLLCFILGPIAVVVGIAFKFTDIKALNIVGNICGLIGIFIMLLLQFGKFEDEDETAILFYGKACSFVLESVLLLGLGANLVAMIKKEPIIITTGNFALITGVFMIILGIAFKVCEHRGNM